MKSYWVRWAPNPVTNVPLRGHTGRRPCNDSSRDQSDTTMNKRTPRIPGNQRSSEEARQESPLEPSEGVWDTGISDFQPPEW